METLIQKLADLEEQAVLAQVQQALDDGTDPLQIFEACRQGMVLVGDRYESGEYFVSDLMLAADIFKSASAILQPSMVGVSTETKGAVVMGTVAGDIHDIGKDLTVGMLQASGYQVHDLGVDVAPAAFVGKLQETGATVLGLSGLLTIAFDAMKETIAAVEAAGLRPGVKVMIGGGRIAPALTSIWLSHIAEPGRELPPESLWQVQEAEVMTVEDYDTIIDKGWNAFLMEYMPRVIDPAEFGAWIGWNQANGARVQQTYREHGYVVVCDAPVMAPVPFEPLCGGRSMSKFFLDLYRIPDKVQAVMDVMLVEILATIEATPTMFGIGGTWLGGWRAASALLAPKLWDRFVWPYYVRLAEALVNKGITPVLHWDQDWTRDLGRLKELPAKKCILNPDGMTDLLKFKELAGDHMAVMGDVPASLFAAGTPDDIYDYVRCLVRDVGPTGLILCPGCDAPINTKSENMEAYVAAAHEIGMLH
jgi:methanogenic corrinoid protein MtbC1